MDYLDKIGKILGVDFQPASGLSLPELQEGIRTKDIDFIASLSKTRDMEPFYLFSKPYLSMPINIFSLDTVSYIGNLNSLKNKRVAVIDGYAIEEWLSRDYPDIDLIAVKNVEEGLRLVSSEEAFVFVGNTVTTSYYVGQERLQHIRVAGETPYSDKQSMAVRRDLPVLATILQKALDAIPESEHASIYNRWMSTKYEHSFNYTILLWILFGVTLILLAFIYWNRRLARAEAALKKANDRLKELDQLKSMFLATMSHELRTPLNSIIGFTGIMLQGILGELNEQQRDSLKRVRQAGRHLLALIVDVIDISKIEAGRIEVCAEEIQLQDLLLEAVESIEPLAASKRLSLSTHGAEGVVLHTDRKRLFQCVLNFLSNAMKFTETGGVTILVELEEEHVTIAIKDTGIGISKEDQSNLFNPFERVDSHLQVQAGGTGLGLYLTRKICVDLLQGNTFMKSRPGEGSTFGLCIPRNLPEQSTLDPLSIQLHKEETK